jgi:hypothetical protein
MPFIVTITDTKPEDQDFDHLHAEGGVREEHRETATTYQAELLDYIKWVQSYPGVLDRRGYAKDDHTWVTVTVFETEEYYRQFQIDAQQHPTVLKRKELGANRGIVRTITTEQIDL